MSESASHHASATSGIPQPHGGLGIFRLVTTVITLIVGGGVFTLAGDQAAGGASGAAILTAWSISGIGVLCLVMTFFALSRIKPQLKGGIYSYANAGFGDFLGFNSAWGYWISALLCTVSFSALLFGALSYFFPIFGGGTNLPSVIGASLLIWFLQTFDSRLNVVTDSANSLLAALGGLLAPLFAPLGFGDWRVSTALITGFSAKEAVVSTLAVLTGSSLTTLPQALGGMFTPLTAFVFLTFTLLYTPCVAAIAAVRREMGSAKAAAGVALAQCAIAWGVAFVVRCIGLALGLG